MDFVDDDRADARSVVMLIAEIILGLRQDGAAAIATLLVQATRLIVFAGYMAFLIGMQFYQKLLFIVLPLAVFALPWVLLRAAHYEPLGYTGLQAPSLAPAPS